MEVDSVNGTSKEEDADDKDVKLENEEEGGVVSDKMVLSPVSLKRNSDDSNDSEDEPPVKRQKLKSALKPPRTMLNGEPIAADASVPSKGPKKSGRKSVTFEDTASEEETKSDEKDEEMSYAEQQTDTKAEEMSSASHEETPVANESSANESDSAEESEDEEKPEVVVKAREKLQTTLSANMKNPYPDWKEGESVPYAALCTTFSKVEMTTKRLEIMAHCSLFLQQVLRLTPKDLLPTVLLMVNKLAADYTGVELGIGESFIVKAIGETTGRSLSVIKNDQKQLGDLGLVAVKSRANQPTMFKPKALTVRGVHEGLLAIAKIQGQGSGERKISGIKKLLSAADSSLAGKGVDINKDKGGPSESKFIIRTLEGKMRLGLAEKTLLVSLAQAVVSHEAAQKGSVASADQLAKGEALLKAVYKYVLDSNEFPSQISLTSFHEQ